MRLPACSGGREPGSKNRRLNRPEDWSLKRAGWNFSWVCLTRSNSSRHTSSVTSNAFKRCERACIGNGATGDAEDGGLLFLQGLEHNYAYVFETLPRVFHSRGLCGRLRRESTRHGCSITAARTPRRRGENSGVEGDPSCPRRASLPSCGTSDGRFEANGPARRHPQPVAHARRSR
jgi:hypothetical protein